MAGSSIYPLGTLVSFFPGAAKEPNISLLCTSNSTNSLPLRDATVSGCVDRPANDSGVRKGGLSHCHHPARRGLPVSKAAPSFILGRRSVRSLPGRTEPVLYPVWWVSHLLVGSSVSPSLEVTIITWSSPGEAGMAQPDAGSTVSVLPFISDS